jgi:pimeloyl-ACP methyl ester carboxylesterase
MAELRRDGIHLAYEEAGRGGPPLLLVHGFGGDARHFAPQLAHFQRRRRVVVLDRRGHGRSDKPPGPYGIAATAEEIIWTVRELGLYRPVLVVHAMGAIGLEVAAQAPELLSAVVALDAPTYPPPPTRRIFEAIGDGLRSPRYREVLTATYEPMVFLPGGDPVRQRQLRSGLLETPQQVLADTWQAFLGYDPTAAVSGLRVPLLHVGSVMPIDEARLRRLCPAARLARTQGAGHFAQLEVPTQINTLIEEFLAATLPARS